MILSKKQNNILQFLYDWDEKEGYLFKLEDVHSVAFYDKVMLNDYHMANYFGVDLTPHYKHQFYEFATDGAGSMFAFWAYDGLIGEAPIIFLGSEGGGTYLAANLEDFVSAIIHNIDFNAGWRCEGEPLEEDLDEFYDELHYDSGEVLSKKDTIALFAKQRIEFKTEASKIMTIHSLAEIQNNLKQHPSFQDWYAEVETKFVR